jgi:hypothetical protein
MFGLTVRAIKVFKPKKQFTFVDVGTQPSNHGCAQVANMQPPGWGRCETANHLHILPEISHHSYH